MNEKVAEALSYVDEKYVSDAAKRSKKKTKYWISAIAAVLALVLLFQIPGIPMAISAQAVSVASDSRQMQRPDRDDYESRDAWIADLDKLRFPACRSKRITSNSFADRRTVFPPAISILVPRSSAVLPNTISLTCPACRRSRALMLASNSPESKGLVK